MDIKKFKNKLKRYEQKQTNETEHAIVEAWYKSYEADEKPLSTEARQRIRLSIKDNIDTALDRKIKLYQLPLVRTAAILVVFSAIALLLFKLKTAPGKQDTYYTISTSTNSVKEITLPDSSRVWINSASRLRFPAEFTSNTRRVEVLEGEAFFQVKHNPVKPFIVHVSQLKIQVLGTSFNISAYHSLKNIKVSVATGKVGVVNGKQTLALLTPGRQLTFNKENKTSSSSSVDPNEVQGWKTGVTYLSQASFEELSVAFKNLFGFKLKAANAHIKAYRFTLKLQRNLPFEDTLKMICLMHNTHFKKEGNEIIIY